MVVAPEDVTVYCDGVPYWWTLTKPYAGGTKTATVKGHGASFTHDVCEGEDALATYCADPYIYPIGRNTSDAPVEVTRYAVWRSPGMAETSAITVARSAGNTAMQAA